MRHVHCRALVCALAIAAAPVAVSAQDRPPPAPCSLKSIGSAVVSDVLDGRTLKLADGREVRLAGIEVPDDTAGAAEARAALHALVSGRQVALKRLGGERDRYGRVLALVIADGMPQTVQHALLAAGHARVGAMIGDKACAADLLRIENEARAARLGVWANRHYVVRGADNPAAILAEKGRFMLIEGRVLSVRPSGGTIYLNFGRRWSRDFTVTVPRRSERAFAAAGMQLKNLTGRHVRVRGTIEERGGPWIEVVRPEQIELAERK